MGKTFTGLILSSLYRKNIFLAGKKNRKKQEETGINVWHGDKNVRHGDKNVRHGAKNVRHGAKNVQYCAKNMRHGAKNVPHGSENVRHSAKNDKGQRTKDILVSNIGFQTLSIPNRKS